MLGAHLAAFLVSAREPGPGGGWAAAIYSLVESTKLNGLDPQADLREVLTRIADHRMRTALLAGPITRITAVSKQDIDPSMIEALQGASSLHLGQAMRFVDFRDGQMRRGKIIAFKDTQATVLEHGTQRTTAGAGDREDPRT